MDYYYVIVSQNGGAFAVTAYTSENGAKNKNDAFALYHTEMGYRHSSRTKTEAIVCDGNFQPIAHEVYINENA